ncbi:MAG: bile acid:sodium symporter family protein [Pseudomonadota bacterium]
MVTENLAFILLPLALAFIMFSLGLGLTIADFKRVFVYPKAFVAGLTCQVILLPLVAFSLLQFMDLSPALSFGVMILSFCPGGVSSNIMTKLAGGAVALSISLTGVVSLLSVLTIPFFISLFATHFLGEGATDINVTGLGLALFVMTAAPAGCGVALRHSHAGVVERVEPLITKLAMGVFFVIVLFSIASNWVSLQESFLQLGPLLVGLNIFLFLMGIIVAWALGLPQKERMAIAIETGIQNSALGVTVASLAMPVAGGLPVISLPAAVYGVTFYFVAAPFILWARQQ